MIGVTGGGKHLKEGSHQLIVLLIETNFDQDVAEIQIVLLLVVLLGDGTALGPKQAHHLLKIDSKDTRPSTAQIKCPVLLEKVSDDHLYGVLLLCDADAEISPKSGTFLEGLFV